MRLGMSPLFNGTEDEDKNELCDIAKQHHMLQYYNITSQPSDQETMDEIVSATVARL